ncbi:MULTISPECIES: PTS sugar transporter subunit IIA [Thermoactinomyces]|uniref:Ascorbate-specific PTS system EIIA component n=1 Tax=Thermoactinomyces daqus TaxID=1329516 RepID=A0A7W1XAK1_9BACL|nr:MULTISPECIES: PTS sugar transporter subunit IIA [Thermoactinomyces]MBA4543094.1 PTS sugar transporter subunit IIA [Thermoactinomyces daqus]MBH8596671.1 PTS sugar transporter subunit IIA [Thermoactinomyces sp. CICC 10523]MBH8603433.1 PTS sugar transporter subunit IIA [Thermoactinomyces sp. CICC 10522]MBH8609273.1 PTS sugar transporter subunit IIA [Thermoactinomyces sp. CICC 10521]
MLHHLITRETIVLKDFVSNWKEAIKSAAEPLLKLGLIREEYVSAMIEIIEKLGPYVVLTPHVAIAHARPEAGVNRLSMSLLRLKESVFFGMGKEVHLVIVLAAEDNQLHLKALAELASLLREEENVDKIIHAENPDEILTIIRRYSAED